MTAPETASVRAAYDAALGAYLDARAAFKEAQRNLAQALQREQRRRAFDAFQDGDCTWCSHAGRTVPVLDGGRATGKHICSDCRGRHAALGPALHGSKATP